MLTTLMAQFHILRKDKSSYIFKIVKSLGISREITKFSDYNHKHAFSYWNKA